MLTPLEEDTHWTFEATKLVAESFLKAEQRITEQSITIADLDVEIGELQDKLEAANKALDTAWCNEKAWEDTANDWKRQAAKAQAEVTEIIQIIKGHEK